MNKAAGRISPGTTFAFRRKRVSHVSYTARLPTTDAAANKHKTKNNDDVHDDGVHDDANKVVVHADETRDAHVLCYDLSLASAARLRGCQEGATAAPLLLLFRRAARSLRKVPRRPPRGPQRGPSSAVASKKLIIDKKRSPGCR